MAAPSASAAAAADEGTKEIVTGTATYDGASKDGKKHGFGVLRWDDGDMYEGEFEDDEKVKGTFRWSNGDVYTGDWRNSLMHGQGTYTYKDGREYSGAWNAGFKHGRGVFKWVTSDTYDGEFERDYIHGWGEHRYADGRIYRGEWEKDKKHGHGTLSWPTGEKMEGTWVNGALQGQVVSTEKDKTRFLESWIAGKLVTRTKLKRTGADMDALMASNTRPMWQQDDDAHACLKCTKAFSFTNRRHHCRRCGLIFCAECTTNKIAIPKLDYQGPERVCDECFISMKANRQA